MKSIVIHAGPGKTGSSALQKCLHSNREALAAQGVLYPEHQLDANGISSGHIFSVGHFENKAFVVEPEKVERLVAQFEQSPHHTLILSSEFFSRAIPTLQRLLPQASFILYLRSPLHSFNSGYIQTVKRPPMRTAKIGDYQPSCWLLDFYKNFQHKDHLTIRPYLFDFDSQWSLAEDFLSQIKDLSLSDFVLSSQRVNTSYSFEALEFKRSINHKLVNHADLQKDLDLFLQSLPYQGSYSLTSENVFKQNLAHTIDLLNDFQDSMPLPSVTTLIEHLKNFTYQSYHVQQDEMPHDKIWSLLAQSNPDLEQKLQLLAQDNYLQENCANLLKKIRNNPGFGAVELLRDMGLLFESEHHYAAAHTAMSLAHSLRPDGPLIKKKLKEIEQVLQQDQTQG